jgi:hypothetical protein
MGTPFGNGSQGNNGGPQEKKPDVFKYRCKEECTFQGKFRRPGEIVFLSEKKDVPHFELIEK